MFDRKDKSYDKDSLQTPQYLFDWLNDIFEFDVDVAASHKHHLCKNYITKEGDALSMERWGKRGDSAFCNPPYSRGMIDAFLDEAIRQLKLYNITTVFVIPELNGELRTKKLMEYGSHFCHFNKRISFIHPLTGKPQKSNNRGTVIVAITSNKVLGYHSYIDLDAIINNYS